MPFNQSNESHSDNCHDNKTFLTPYTVALVTHFVLNFFVNVPVVVIGAVNRRVREIRNLYVVALSLADTLVSFNSLLAVVWLNENDLRDQVQLCNFFKVYLYATLFCSLTTLTLVAFDRFVFVTFPFFYLNTVTAQKAVVFISTSWVGSLTYVLLMRFTNRLEHGCYYSGRCDVYTLLYQSRRLALVNSGAFLFMIFMAFLAHILICQTASHQATAMFAQKQSLAWSEQMSRTTLLSPMDKDQSDDDCCSGQPQEESPAAVNYRKIRESAGSVQFSTDLALGANQTLISPGKVGGASKMPRVTPVTADSKVHPITAGKKIHPIAADNKVHPITVDNKVNPIAADKKVRPLTVEKKVHPITAGKKIHPIAADNKVHPITVDNKVNPIAADNKVRPLTVEKKVHPIAAYNRVKPVTADNKIHPVVHDSGLSESVSLSTVYSNECFSYEDCLPKSPNEELSGGPLSHKNPAVFRHGLAQKPLRKKKKLIETASSPAVVHASDSSQEKGLSHTETSTGHMLGTHVSEQNTSTGSIEENMKSNQLNTTPKYQACTSTAQARASLLSHKDRFKAVSFKRFENPFRAQSDITNPISGFSNRPSRTSSFNPPSITTSQGTVIDIPILNVIPPGGSGDVDEMGEPPVLSSGTPKPLGTRKSERRSNSLPIHQTTPKTPHAAGYLSRLVVPRLSMMPSLSGSFNISNISTRMREAKDVTVIRLRVMRKMVRVFACLSVCWFPLIVLGLLGPLEASPDLVMAFGFLVLLNSTANAFVYAWSDHEIRLAIVDRVFKCCRPWRFT